MVALLLVTTNVFLIIIWSLYCICCWKSKVSADPLNRR